MGLLDFLRHGEGKEVTTPPPSLNPDLDRQAPLASLLFTYSQRREPREGPSFLAAPDDQYQAMLPLAIAPQEAPDPIRQSMFYAEGKKVHPWAQQRITSHLAIGSKEAVMEDSFRVGKLLGYLRINSYAGAQLPSVIRTNIKEAVPTTYGSLYEVEGVVPMGAAVLASGLQMTHESPMDGYPY